MGNKQKLPKHIIAYENISPHFNGHVILKSKETNLCAHANKKSKDSLKMVVEWLDSGKGWEEDEYVGKQIVF